MIGRLVLLLAVALTLAGCSGSTEEPPSASTSTSTTAGPSPVEAEPETPAMTDTVRLAADFQLLARSAPTGLEPNLTVFPYTGPGSVSDVGTRLVWSYTFTNNSQLTGFKANVWVRVSEALYGQPSQLPLCAWGMVVRVVDPDGTIRVSYPVSCSGPAGPTIAAGDYELSFASSASGAGVSVGVTLQVELYRDVAAPSQSDSVHVLTGAVEFDSRIQLLGVAEPLAA